MKFAVLADWPDVKNAEYEVIKRIQFSAKKVNCECIVVDPQGYVINLHNKGYSSSQRRVCDDDEVQFVLNLHFASPKVFDKFVFATTWNPPQFFFDWGYDLASKHFLTADDYLVYGSRPIKSHLTNLLSSSRKSIHGAINMVPSVPEVDRVQEHGLDTGVKVFYSGINWERLSNKNGRHHELFLLLDDCDFMRFHGPQKFLGQQPWAGFKNFHGEIPFDGLSTIDVIQECGVSLVLSSDIHRDSHAATNRLYESLEAGAVIISDDNAFVLENFGDVVLPITYSKTPSNTFKQIVKHVEWIKNHQGEAKEMAHKAHLRYREKFGLERQIKHIVDSFPARADGVSENLEVIEDVGVVHILISILNFLDVNSMASTISSLKKQKYSNFKLCFFTSSETQQDLEDLLHHKELNYAISNVDNLHLEAMNKENDDLVIPKGRLLELLAEKETVQKVIFIEQGDVFFSNHLSSLLFPLVNEAAMASHSGWINEDKANKRHIHYFGETVTKESLVGLVHRPVAGSFMFKFTGEYSFWFMDNFLESMVAANCCLTGEMAFTGQATIVKKEEISELCINFDDVKQLEIIRDSIRYELGKVELDHSAITRSAIVSDEQFVDVQKRVVWSFFERMPRFQRFCQRCFHWVRGIVK